MSIASSWCISKHFESNHLYDGYLPYEFHLRMVVQVYEEFKYLLSENYITTEQPCYHNTFETVDITHSAVELACLGHDLIEDARCSYNDCRSRLGFEVAEIIYAVTNEKGRNRKERANNKYYEGIINTPGAVFVKLCDRIANVRYSKMTNSRMLEMYRKENEEFRSKLFSEAYQPMFDCLENLLTEKQPA